MERSLGVRNRASDFGGYLDQLADTIGYAAVPIGIAVGQGSSRAYGACALLLATFYVNTLSWSYLSAIAEKRAEGAVAQIETTSIHMPSGLIEGAEKIVLFTVMLAIPAQAPVTFGLMAFLVVVTVLQRVAWAASHL